jgi:hypothetical protein
MSYAFSDAALRQLERYIIANVRQGCDMLEERSGARAGEKGIEGKASEGWADAWNVAQWCNWLVFDIMGDLVFGKAFGMLESPKNRFAVELVGNAAHRHLIVSFSSLFSVCLVVRWTERWRRRKELGWK